MQLTTNEYRDFLESRSRVSESHGFDPVYMPEFLKDFQRYLVEWSLRVGRGAIFADCGMGKTPMQLVWADNVVRKTNKSVLILTPLAVSYQTVNEAEKFGVECRRSSDGRLPSPPMVIVANYERLHYFNPSDFAGVVCDESSAIKNFDGSRTAAVTEFMRKARYRLLCTATAAPNDYFELGTSSEALGCLGFRDMITTFFKQETTKDHLGWGRTKYRFRGHAEKPFWRWVCSWSRAIRSPSDYGFDDTGYLLPPLIEREIALENSTPRDGMLFAMPARNMQEEREERRITIQERCEKMASLMDPSCPGVAWCHLNDEGDLLEKLVPDSKQVCGSMADEEKEEALLAFSRGELRKLITKPKIGCWGLNWQHCCEVNTFPSHSFEQYYQAVRRCWRFGQQNPVTVNIVATAGEQGIIKNLQRKAAQAEQLYQQIVECMVDELKIGIDEVFPETEEIPAWLS